MIRHLFHRTLIHIRAFRSDHRSLRESLLTLVLAIILGGTLAIAFIPSIKKVVWPAVDKFFSSFVSPELVDTIIALFA